MKTSPLISVLIPVYNVEDYLARCMECMCGQTYRNLEFICVDDGSTDRSLEILRTYEAKDSRVKVISQPNKGVASARNAALSIAQGEWITGMDPDDYIVKDAYERLVRTASDDVDMIVFGTQVVVEEDNPSLRNRIKSMQSVYDRDLAKSGRHLLTPEEAHRISVLVWNKLLRHSLLKECGLRFNENLWNDSDFCFYKQWCAHLKSVYYVNERLHRRLLRSTSISFSTDKQTYEWRCKSHLLSMASVISHHRKVGTDKRDLKYLRDLITHKVDRLMEFRAKTENRHIWVGEFMAAIRECGIEKDSQYADVILNNMDRLRSGKQCEHFYQACMDKGRQIAHETATSADIALTMIVSDKKLTPAVVTLQNVKETLSVSHSVCVYLLAESLSCFSRNTLASMESERFRVFVIELGKEVELSQLAEDPVTKSTEGYLKTILPVLLPSLQRCIYIEPGLLLGRKFAELQTMELGQAFIAAVPQATGDDIARCGWDIRNREKWRNLGIKNFYAPQLMVMDLAAMRQADAVRTWLEACMMQRDIRPFPVQHALNLSLQDNMMPLPGEVAHYCINMQELMAAHHDFCNTKAPSWPLWMRSYENSPLAQFPMQPFKLPAKPRVRNNISTPAFKSAPPQTPILISLIHLRWVIAYRYYCCRILAALTWGQRKQHYIQQRREYRAMRLHLREARRDAMVLLKQEFQNGA